MYLFLIIIQGSKFDNDLFNYFLESKKNKEKNKQEDNRFARNYKNEKYRPIVDIIVVEDVFILLFKQILEAPKGYVGVKPPNGDSLVAFCPTKDKTLYIFYKYGKPTDVPITNIGIVKSEYNEICPLSYTLINVDLGHDSYLCYTKSPGCPIVDIVARSEYFYEECPYGYEEVGYSVSGYYLQERDTDCIFCIKRVFNHIYISILKCQKI